MARAAALTLALGSAVATWIWPDTGIGFVGVGAALWAMFLPLRKRTRVGVLVIACVSYLGSSAVRLHALADEIAPWNTIGWGTQGDTWDLTLPLASMAEFDVHQTFGRWINLDRRGQILFRGLARSLAELAEVFADAHARPVLLRVDRNAPFQHFAWVLEVARAAGHDRVFVAAKKYVDIYYTVEEAKLVGGQYGGGWPESWFALALDAPDTGTPLRIIPRKAEARLFGPYGHEQQIEMPTTVSYELGGRRTESLDELAKWMRATPPGRIEPGPTVPIKFVVAVINLLMEAKLPVPALVRPEAPSDAARRAGFLPYPRRG